MVALVTTIIILLILAGITITMILGSNGIFTKATNAKIETRISQLKEDVALAWISVQTKYNGEVPEDKIEQEMLLELKQQDDKATAMYADKKITGVYQGEIYQLEIGTGNVVINGGAEENPDGGSSSSKYITEEKLQEELTKALTENVLKQYPIGSIYITTNATNPQEYIGGIWQRYGNGKAIVGVSEGETEFATVEKTGGAKTQTLSIDNLPSHTHEKGTLANASKTLKGTLQNFAIQSSSQNITFDGIIKSSGKKETVGYAVNLLNNVLDGITIDATHTHTISGSTAATGTGTAHNNLQPYITCYIWKRTK